ncbi:MAG: methionyl-tRNA formyltransferase [Spirochaetia bacterium]|nr:methionyl-tRNA formyltransferase [Spirochaetota bacterium]MCX8096090.1 methionyl-tRNA formyltransferase [Spirochaetota bacterium]MDW8113103.1 methionyl-tRNA formyltransferase [Spirochaetia bacterium]
MDVRKKFSRICYFGSGEFSRMTLEEIVKFVGSSLITLVITKSDKEKGRGRKLQPTPVKEFAIEKGIEVWDSEDIKSEGFINYLRSKGFDLFIVCDYGKIIPKSVFEIPRFRSIGVHPSLLPKYRGASPIHYALLNLDEITGTTIFYLNERMDAGDILIQKEISVDEDDNYTSLSKKLAILSAEAVVEFIENPDVKPRQQDESKATYTRMITKEDGRIDWAKEARYILGQVRAFVEWPKAYTFYKGKIIKILKARCLDEDRDGVIGGIVGIKGGIQVKTGKGILEIQQVLPESSKPMDAMSFVNGYRLKVGDTFE